MRIIGLMSGTSTDGVDAAVVDIENNKVDVIAFDTFAYSASMRRRILEMGEQKLCRPADISGLNFEIGGVFAEAVKKLCGKHKINLKTIDLIGSHGQTIFHSPAKNTLQIGEPSIIAYKTGIKTVADFRPMDIAAGGQGAPLVPFADYFLFKSKKNRVVQNIGGIANLTFLPANCKLKDVIAFDSGPGNMIIDRLVFLLTKGKQNFDKGGKISVQGKVNSKILSQMLTHPYLRRKPPKTTGREMFGKEYADEFFKKLPSKDVIATATAFTAISIADAYRKFLPIEPDEVILCGGGARNDTLVKMLRENIKAKILFTDDFGISSDAKEAVSFAILAYATINGMPNNVPNATGAREPVVLGKIIK
ncbi:MAG: anhydro-N-acetylmuramic acid kinase [Planctomycetes bacterium GWF2_41_51]|nr:MAG: anhydro-N-acetylmuramic acid kinase [Planctomycetes bacterium GWF2_41_51]HBG25787.1 anhydro-N-acetylmuramic acid kinase [Phycisphaerales bacterium]